MLGDLTGMVTTHAAMPTEFIKRKPLANIFGLHTACELDRVRIQFVGAVPGARDAANTSSEAALKAVTLLRDRLMEVVKKHDWPMSFSIGLASFETMPDSVDAMISAADQLMYEVKQERKGDIRQRVL